MEGPGVHVIADELSGFIGQSIEAVTGTVDAPLAQLVGQEIDDVRAVKKRLFFDIGEWHAVIHFLMYGSYRVNESRDREPQLKLTCETDTFAVYGSSVKILEADSEELAEYDQPQQDVLSPSFDRQRAVDTLTTRNDYISDVLLDQAVYGGVGNRVKNEVLWELQIHPETPANELPPGTCEALVDETIRWMKEWQSKKQAGESMPHQIYQHKNCPRCNSAVERGELGSRSRVTYWCPDCQPAGRY